MNDTTTGLVGRDSEIALVHARISAGASAFVSGLAGVGKSHLVHEAVRDLGRSPLVVTRGTVTGRAIPLAALERVVPPSASAARDALAHLRSAWSDLGPVVLVVDDAHLLDDVSAFVVRSLAEDRTCAVVATAPDATSLPEQVALLADLCADGGRIELKPLDAAASRRLAERWLGGTASERVHRELWRLTAGNPLELGEILAAARRAGSLRQVGGAWEWTGGPVAPRKLAERLQDRLLDLDEEARRLFELVALAGSLLADDLGAVLDVGPDAARDACDRLEAARLVTVGGPPAFDVQTRHPLHAALVVAGLPSLARRRHAASLAAAPAGDDPRRQYLRTHWMLDAGLDVSARRLVAAALHALERGATEAAAELAAAARGREESHRAALVSGTAYMMSGDIDAARAALRAAVDLATTPGERFAASNQLAGLEFDHGATPEAADLVLDAAGASPYLDARRALHLVLRGDHEAAAGLVTRFDDADLQLAFVAAVSRSLSSTMSGDPAAGAAIATDALARRRRARTAVHLPTVPVLTVAQIFAHRELGELAHAEELAGDAYEAASRDDDHRAQGWYALMLGNVELATGRYARADHWLRESIVQFGRSRYPAIRWPYAGAAQAAALGGDPGRAASLIRELDDVAASCWTFLDYELVRARAWTLAASGGVAAARDMIREAAGSNLARSAPARRAFALDLVRLGDAQTFVTAVDGIDRIVAWHATANGAGDVPGLQEVAEAYRVAGFRGAELDSLVQVATHAYAAGEQAAIEHARRARELAQVLGTDSWSLGVMAQTIGASPRQLEIGRHAAAGQSNPEIASALFLSVRTVENHLAALFKLLRISRRDDLRNALDAWFGTDPVPAGRSSGAR